jgi:hypothetical protein
MRRLTARVGFVLALALVTASPAGAAIDDIVQVNKGTAYQWQGQQTAATNANYFGGYLAPTPATPATPVGECDKDLNSYCEVILFKVNNPITAAEQAAGVTKKTANVRISVDWTETPVIFANLENEPTDFDILAYASNDLGDKGDELDTSTQSNTINERVDFAVETFVGQPAAWVLLEVVYFSVPNENGYTGKLTFPS